MYEYITLEPAQGYLKITTTTTTAIIIRPRRSRSAAA